MAEQHEVTLPKCISCGADLKGLNISGMKLPMAGPDGKPCGKAMTFMIPCCPSCNTCLTVQFTGIEEAPAPGAASGLWVPPGRA